MEEITSTALHTMLEEYQARPENKIVRKALAKTRISDIVKVSEKEQNTAFHFSLALETLPAVNQLQSGRCWIFAGCNILREKIAKKYQLENFEVSQSYLAFYDKLERANYFMEKLLSFTKEAEKERFIHHLLTIGVEDGGQWDMFVNIVRKYGLVPKEVMPETFQSSNTTEVNRLLNQKLRQFAAFVLEQRPNLEALKQKSLSDIFRLLVDCYGLPPTKFDFEYTSKDKQYHVIKDLTPQQFYEQCVDIHLEDYLSIINAPTKDKPFYRLFTVKELGNVLEGSHVQYLNLPIKDFKQAVIQQLTNLEPVWFGSDCDQAFERDKGVWDDSLLAFDEVLGIDFAMSKGQALMTYGSTMNHAMMFTGVHLENGVPRRFKIENSWGEEKGKKGYFVASDSWFDKYVYQAVIHKKYLKEELLEVLKTSPIELMPWDPMGTLANN